jgi:hypothetical protein
VTARRRVRRDGARVDHDLAIVRRARTQVGQLPTATLKRIHDLLEQALSGAADEGELIAGLERELGRRS